MATRRAAERVAPHASARRTCASWSNRLRRSGRAEHVAHTVVYRPWGSYDHRSRPTLLLAENESTYIPVGTSHRLENPGRIPLHLVEVQTGTYLGEDDIVRFEDAYGR
jgi:mannose-6-phosphate isomerase-like protein (cupin superfamily)